MKIEEPPREEGGKKGGGKEGRRKRVESINVGVLRSARSNLKGSVEAAQEALGTLRTWPLSRLAPLPRPSHLVCRLSSLGPNCRRWSVCCVNVGVGTAWLAPWAKACPPPPTPSPPPFGGRAGLSQQACPLPGGVDHGHAALPRAVRAPGPWHHAARRLQRHQRLPAHRLLPPKGGHGQCLGTTHPGFRVGVGSQMWAAVGNLVLVLL